VHPSGWLLQKHLSLSSLAFTIWVFGFSTALLVSGFTDGFVSSSTVPLPMVFLFSFMLPLPLPKAQPSLEEQHWQPLSQPVQPSGWLLHRQSSDPTVSESRRAPAPNCVALRAMPTTAEGLHLHP